MIFFVYPFAEKEIITVSNDPKIQIINLVSSSEMMNFMVMFIFDNIKGKSSVEKAFNKSTSSKLKGFFITHIDVDPVFNTKDAQQKVGKALPIVPLPESECGRK